VLEEGMLEVECPAVTPEAVLKASGHVDRFTDAMVKDEKTGDCYRADHLLEAALEAALEGRPINKPPAAAKKGGAVETPAPLSGEARQRAIDLLARVGELDCDALGDALNEYGVLAPDTGNAISRPFPFNLMFKTSIGPRGDLVGFLRPETAQGIFVNFRDLLYYNGGKLPFAAAQIGNSYRNEIAPRAGLLRVREFTQAEIEHFVNPEDKRHPKFSSVASLKPLLYARKHQMGAEKKPEAIALGDAVAQGIIANETLAYFIGRTWLFFQRVGVDPARMRFRQHLQHEVGCLRPQYGWPPFFYGRKGQLFPIGASAHAPPSSQPKLTTTHLQEKTRHRKKPTTTHQNKQNRWPTTPRIAGTPRSRPPTAGSSAQASPTAPPTT
jgi:glycyl-tRNA synthetase